MKKLLFLLMFGCFGGSLSFACSHCQLEANKFVCKGGEPSGNCRCTQAGSECAACGFCYVFVCVQGCSAKVTDARMIIRVADEPKRPPATADWLNDENLPVAIQALSPTMASLIAQEQEKLKKDWCVNFRRGLLPDTVKPNRFHRWEMFGLPDGSVQYRIIDTDEVLIVVPGVWRFERKGEIVSEGPMAIPAEATLPSIIGGMSGF